MPCSINFSMTLQTEILSTALVTSDFLKQMIILKSGCSDSSMGPLEEAAEMWHPHPADNIMSSDK